MAANPYEVTLYGPDVCDGNTGEFTYGFDVAGSFSAVIVQHQPTGEEGFSTVDSDDYDHLPGSKTISFHTGSFPEAGYLRISRSTTLGRPIDYIAGSALTSRRLDADANRLTAVTQEIEAGQFDGMRKSLDGQRWEAEGLPIADGSPSEGPDYYVIRSELDAALSGIQVAEVTEPLDWTFAGDGIETEFELQGVRGLRLRQPTVWLNGIIQDPNAGNYDIVSEDETGYPTGGDGNDYLVFDTAPPDGATIYVKALTGQVLGVLPADFVNDPDQILADTINQDHIQVESGDAGRVMVFGADGQPTLPVPGLQHLINVAQTLPAAAKSALVAAIRLSDLAAPNADVPMGGHKLTGLGAPTAASTDAATAVYVDGKIAGLPQFAIGSMTMPAPGNTSALQVCGFHPNAILLIAIPGALARVAYSCYIHIGTTPKQVVAYCDRGAGQANQSHLVFTPSATGFTVSHGDLPLTFQSSGFWAAMRIP